MKIKDIFTHSWVVSFEKELIEKEKTDSLELPDKFNKSSNEKINFKEESQMKLKKDSQNISKIQIKDENLQISQEKNKKGSFKGSQIEESREKIQESLNSHKKSSIQMAIDSSDFQLENLEKTDSLFDKVLTQVKERNKGKF